MRHEEERKNVEASDNGSTGGSLVEPTVEGKGLKIVRLGSGDRTLPQGVFGVEAVSQRTVGSEGIFMSQHRVPPGAHSSLHVHTNCESVVYVLRGTGYAYSGEEMDDYVEGGPGDFAYIPADLAHVVGCPVDSEPLEYVVARNAPEEVVVTLREADELPIGPDGKIRDGKTALDTKEGS